MGVINWLYRRKGKWKATYRYGPGWEVAGPGGAATVRQFELIDFPIR